MGKLRHFFPRNPKIARSLYVFCQVESTRPWPAGASPPPSSQLAARAVCQDEGLRFNPRGRRIDQELIEFLEQRFDKNERRIEKRFAENERRTEEQIRQTHVMIEALRSALQGVAEGVLSVDQKGSTLGRRTRGSSARLGP